MQYRNWATPESIRKTRKASMNFNRSGVCSLYAFRSEVIGERVAGLVGAFGGILSKSNGTVKVNDGL